MTKNDGQSTKVATTSEHTVPSLLVNDLLSAHAGEGMENVKPNNMVLPTLLLLQKLSPELDESSSRYITGAKPGDFLNRLTGAVYSGQDGVLVLHVHFSASFIEWVPRDSGGGGFVAKYPTEEIALQSAQPANDIVETYEHYLIIEDPKEGLAPVLFSSAKTKIAASRRWNSIMNRQRLSRSDGSLYVPPTFYRFYKLTSVPAKNKAQQSYYNFMATPDTFVSDQNVIKMCLAFRDSLKAGEVSVIQDYEVLAASDSSDATTPLF
jgi:hypothetical protein